MILGDIVLDPSVPIGNIVTGGVVLAVVGTLGFMLRNSFASFTDSLKSLGGKVDELSKSLNHLDTSGALLKQKVEALEVEVKLGRDRHHEQQSKISALLGNAEAAAEDAAEAKAAVARLEERLLKMLESRA